MDSGTTLVTTFLLGFSAAIHFFKNFAPPSPLSADASAQSGFSDDTTWVFVNGLWMPEIPSAAPLAEAIVSPPVVPVVSSPAPPAYWHLTVTGEFLTSPVFWVFFLLLVIVPFCHFCWTVAGELIEAREFIEVGQLIEDDEPAVSAAEQHTCGCEDQLRSLNTTIHTLAYLCADAFGKAANASQSGFALVANQFNRMQLTIDRLANSISAVQSLALSSSQAIEGLDGMVNGLQEEVTELGKEMMRHFENVVGKFKEDLNAIEEAITALLTEQISGLRDEVAQNLKAAIDKVYDFLKEFKKDILAIQQRAIDAAVARLDARWQAKFDDHKRQTATKFDDMKRHNAAEVKILRDQLSTTVAEVKALREQLSTTAAEVKTLQDQLSTAVETQAEASRTVTTELETYAENAKADKAAMNSKLDDIAKSLHQELDERAYKCSSAVVTTKDAASQTDDAIAPPPVDMPSADEPKVDTPPVAESTADTADVNAPPPNIDPSSVSVADISPVDELKIDTPSAAESTTDKSPDDAPAADTATSNTSPSDTVATASSAADIPPAQHAAPTVEPSKSAPKTEAPKKVEPPTSPRPATAIKTEPATDLSKSRWAKKTDVPPTEGFKGISTPTAPLAPATTKIGDDLSKSTSTPLPVASAAPTLTLGSPFSIQVLPSRKVSSTATGSTTSTSDLYSSRWAKSDTPAKSIMKSTGSSGIPGYGDTPAEPAPVPTRIAAPSSTGQGLPSHQNSSTVAGPSTIPSTSSTGLAASRHAPKSAAPSQPTTKTTASTVTPTPAPATGLAASRYAPKTDVPAKPLDKPTASTTAVGAKTAADVSGSSSTEPAATATKSIMKSTGWEGIAGYGNTPAEPTPAPAPRTVATGPSSRPAKPTAASSSSTASTDLAKSRWAPKTDTPTKPTPSTAPHTVAPAIVAPPVTTPVIAPLPPTTSTGLNASRHAPAGLSTSRHAPTGPAPTPTRSSSQQTTVAGPSTLSTAPSAATMSPADAKRLRRAGRGNEVPWCRIEAEHGVCRFHAAAKNKGSREDCQWRHHSDEKEGPK